eukprot:362768_1
MSAAVSSLSQFFILSPRGDSIIRKEFRGDTPKTVTDTFFRNVKFWGGKQQDAPPVFLLDGITYLYLKNNGLFFVGVTRQNVSPSLMMELLLRLTKVFKDYCGVLTEETIRKNFILLYELLDEVLDFGYAQGISTEILKAFVFNEPSLDAKAGKAGILGGFKNKVRISDNVMTRNAKTKSSDAVNRPVQYSRDRKAQKKQRNEIFVDIFERISVTFNSNGYALSSSIDGTIQMKSYLSGNPELKLALNEDLVIGSGANAAGPKYGNSSNSSITLDDCNFHECVRLDEFESSRTLTFIPPDGEFSVLNYRVTNEFRQPFRIFPFFELVSPYKVELIIKIRADIPEQNYGGNVCVELPVPQHCQTVTTELGMGVVGQTSEYNIKDRKVIWKIKKFAGGTEQALRVKITFKEQQTSAIRKTIGPISISFEIPMYNVSNLQVRYLRIMEQNKKYNPYRWVRYVTRSQSYICRL